MEEEQTIPVPETGEESHGPAGEPKPAPPAGEKVEPEEPESDHHEPAAGAATQPVAEPAAEPATDLDAEQLTLREPLDDEFSDATTLAILEAIVYVTDEPLSTQQIASALRKDVREVQRLLDQLLAEYEKPHHGLTIKEVAGGYKIATKPEHHEAVRAFVKNLNPPMKLSMAALETLAVIAYKQPLTAPEIMEIRGVQGAGVLKTLIDRKLITTAGRKNVVGKPILYKTTKEFLVQFGLKDLNELPSLKEFEEIRRLALDDAPSPEEDEPKPPANEPVDAPPVNEPEQDKEPAEKDPPTEEPPVDEPGGEPSPVKASDE